MECNKDDAVKAADLAEKKYMIQDFAAAKKFCAKALQLYPNLERAKQMLSVLEVHAAAHSQLGVEDWYAVLQVDPCADEATIRKQYRKMALMLHPDKNRVLGAETAFKLINEAWMVLSDKSKKIVYDVKRSSRMKPAVDTETNSEQQQQQQHQPQHQPPPPPPPPPPPVNSQSTFWTQCPNCKIQYQYYRKFENYQLLCHRCQTGFIATDIGTPPVESSKWPGAKKKTTNGENGVNGESSAFQQMQQRAREREERRREEERKKAEREREREEKRRLKEALKKAKEEDRRREAMEKQLAKQREREEKEARKKMMEALKKKLKKSRLEEEDDDDDDDDEDEESDEGRIAEECMLPPEVLRFGLRRSNRTRKNVTYRDDDFDEEEGDGPAAKKARMEEELSPDQVALREELAVTGRQRVLEALRVIREAAAKSSAPPETLPEKLDPCVAPEMVAVAAETTPRKNTSETAKQAEPCAALKNHSPVVKGRRSSRVQEAMKASETKNNVAGTCLQTNSKVAEPAKTAGTNARLQPTETEKAVRDEQQAYHRHPQPELEQQLPSPNPSKTAEVQDQDMTEPPSPEDDNIEEESHFLVPDPDFYNFDTDRKESYVREGQVWALYDDTDGMPRFYCEIKQLVSLSPFKVRLRWLERYVSSEEADEWEAAGFTVTCGQFKCKRKTETEAHFNKFSHLMEVDKVHANVVDIYPKRGEVWAVYREWSLKLRQGGSDDGRKPVLYEMVEVVSSYVEPAGTTVLPLVKVEGFKTIFARGNGNLTTYRSKDLLRFSHKVPAHWMLGTEKPNAPHSCWELDTAATPSHLIFVNR